MNNSFLFAGTNVQPSMLQADMAPQKIVKNNLLFNEYNKAYAEMSLRCHIEQEQFRLNQNALYDFRWQRPNEINFTQSFPDDFTQSVNYIRTRTNFSEKSISMIVTSAIAAATLGKVSVCVDGLPNGWIEPVIDFMVQFAEPGTGKSEVIKLIVNPFLKFQGELQSEYDNNRFKNQIVNKMKNDFLNSKYKSFINEVKSQKHLDMDRVNEFIREYRDYSCLDKEGKSSYPEVIHTSGSRYKLSELMQANGDAQILISSEGDCIKTLLVNELDFMLRCYCGERYTDIKKNIDIKLERPALPFIFFIQPSFIKTLYNNKNLRDRGLLSRLSAYYHSPIENLFSNSSAGDISCYNEKITHILKTFYSQNANSKYVELHLSEEAKNFVMRLKDQMFNDELRRRALGKAIRYAGALHIWNEIPSLSMNTKITVNEMTMAYKLACISYAHSFFLMNIYKNIEISKRIINTLLNINDTNLIHCQGIRSAQVRNRLSGVTKDDFDNALRFLASFNYLSIIDSGISSPLLVLHPQFYTRNNPLTHNSM